MRSRPVTELVNEKTKNIDELTAIGIVEMMVEEDRVIYQSIKDVKENIATAIDMIVAQWEKGGRVFVVGAGTSGRIGVLDAAELGPTFSIDPSRWTGLIAGGYEAMWKPLEEHEDDENVDELLAGHQFGEDDVLLGISASGSTPYVLSALSYARDKKGVTLSIACNHETECSKVSDCAIEVIVGPEVIKGSTRLKAGTAQKMILNMISTGVMIRLGKVYQNQMVDMRLINKKLHKRATSMIVELVGDISHAEAEQLLKDANHDLKTAIFMGMAKVDYTSALDYIQGANGHLKTALDHHLKSHV